MTNGGSPRPSVVGGLCFVRPLETSGRSSLARSAAPTSPSGSSASEPARTRARPAASRCSWPTGSTCRMPQRGSPLRPRCPGLALGTSAQPFGSGRRRSRGTGRAGRPSPPRSSPEVARIARPSGAGGPCRAGSSGHDPTLHRAELGGHALLGASRVSRHEPSAMPRERTCPERARLRAVSTGFSLPTRRRPERRGSGPRCRRPPAAGGGTAAARRCPRRTPRCGRAAPRWPPVWGRALR
jgi:hypothetical protein